MWLKNGGLLAAVLAVLTAGAVVAGTWFTLTHSADIETFFSQLTEVRVGAVTLLVILLAGWLLAIALDRAEAVFTLYRQRSSDHRGGGD